MNGREKDREDGTERNGTERNEGRNEWAGGRNERMGKGQGGKERNGKERGRKE